MEDKTKYLYVVFSATPYRMGKLIRFITREPYNHVAISTEKDLVRMYSFARRFYRTPLYGGFVTEEPYRYCQQSCVARVCICRIPITSEQHTLLSRRLRHMETNSRRFIYNHLSALAAPIHLRVRVPDAFTCAEFTVSVLSQLGLPFDPNRFYTIGQIFRILEPRRIYSGAFPLPPRMPEGTSYFNPRPLQHPLYESARSILALVYRRANA